MQSHRSEKSAMLTHWNVSLYKPTFGRFPVKYPSVALPCEVLLRRGSLIFFSPTSRKAVMKAKKASRVYTLTLVYENNLTRDVKVRASSREVAEKRALKRNPNAIGIQARA